MDHREYPVCRYMERRTDEGFLKTWITQEARVLPPFEEKIHKHKCTKGYSFYNNEMLKCRWDELRNTRKSKVPFKFPCVKDEHFIKSAVNHRFHLRSGPSIDRFGQLPIPDDMKLRKTVYFKPKGKKTSKNVGGKAGKKHN